MHATNMQHAPGHLHAPHEVNAWMLCRTQQQRAAYDAEDLRGQHAQLQQQHQEVHAELARVQQEYEVSAALPVLMLRHTGMPKARYGHSRQGL